MRTYKVRFSLAAREMIHGSISREYALDRDMTPDELYDIIASEIDSIYDACHAGPLMVRAYLGVKSDE